MSDDYDDDVCETSVSTFNQEGAEVAPGYGTDHATDLVVDQKTGKTFVTGVSWRGVPGRRDYDWLTFALNEDGSRRWESAYSSPKDQPGGFYGVDLPASLALSPDGTTVFVTGAENLMDQSVATTVAYEAATGDELWVATYDGIQDGVAWSRLQDHATSIVVTPGGEQIVVAAQTYRDGATADYVLLGYDTGSGEEVWRARYGDGDLLTPADIAVSPSGDLVWVTGHSGPRIVTAAFTTGLGEGVGPTAGVRVWTTTHPASSLSVRAVEIALSPDGSRLFVLGQDVGTIGTAFPFGVVIAYESGSGNPVWEAQYPQDHAQQAGYAESLTLSPDGNTAYAVAKISTLIAPRAFSDSDMGVVAYSTSDGTRGWASKVGAVSRTSGQPTFDWPRDILASPDGETVYVTGESQYGNGGWLNWGFNPGPDYVIAPSGLAASTFALSSNDGSERWVAMYQPASWAGGGATTEGGAIGWKLAASQDSKTVYVMANSSSDGLISGQTAPVACMQEPACSPTGNLSDYAVLSYSDLPG